ncbi:formyl peptide receptor 2-like [Vipera latastei]
MSNITEDFDLEDFLAGFDRTATLQKRMQIASLVIYCFAFVLGILGNGLVIFITGFRMKKTVNTVWFLNLAIADFIFIFSLIFVHAAVDFKWYINQFLCKMKRTLVFLNLYTNVFLLMVISIDRCIFVRHPVWAQNHRTPQLASFVALGVWILAFVFSSPHIYFGRTVKNADNKVIGCHNDYGNTKDMQMARSHSLTLSNFVFAFVIPFTVILLCYGSIVLKLRRGQLFQSSKPYKVITALVVAFFVCWFPFHVFSFIRLEYSSRTDLGLVVDITGPITSCLAFINSCLNPILYVFMAQDFKESLRKSFLSAFEDAFIEEVRQTSTTNKTRSSAEVESQL